MTNLTSKHAQHRNAAIEEMADIIMRQVDHETRGVFDWSPPYPNPFVGMDGSRRSE